MPKSPKMPNIVDFSWEKHLKILGFSPGVGTIGSESDRWIGSGFEATDPIQKKFEDTDPMKKNSDVPTPASHCKT